jgi:hypothetical protein
MWALFMNKPKTPVTFEQIEAILKGIDQDEMVVDYGWWETSFGAEFGAKKLAEIKALFDAQQCTSP